MQTPEEIAREALEAFNRRPKLTADEYITKAIRRGFINAKGEVTRLIGGSAEPEPNYESWTPAENGKENK